MGTSLGWDTWLCTLKLGVLEESFDWKDSGTVLDGRHGCNDQVTAANSSSL